MGTSAIIDNAFVHIPDQRFFYGQIAMFCLFNEVLSISNVLELYQLGYNYLPNLHKKEYVFF